MILSCIFLGICFSVKAGEENIPKKLQAFRTESSVKIDGVLDEEDWLMADVATDFVQRSPNPGKRPTQPTEVRIMYDDFAVYIAAIMYEVSRDSVMTFLTARDVTGLADYFSVYFDTYNDNLNAFEFSVTAAGVQRDQRYSPLGSDVNWNAGWFSKVSIHDNYWIVEMEIPFAALRFPKSAEQVWGVNFKRIHRRKNESSYWSEIDPNINGFINQFGVLTGISDVKSPLRLSVSPYVSYYADQNKNSDGFNHIFKGGLDVKYGINDAYTLDMMLIPDFGQVRSDNQVLNLSPFEVFFAEQRQFFTEGTELFDKGGLFYSRRIGGTPIHRGRVSSQLNEGERIVSNPRESSIINASKISGRGRKGLGIGILNAVTAETYAMVENEDGERRRIMTAPLTNYNVTVLDQSLKYNSFFTVINTNVTRSGNFRDANVTGTAFRFMNKKNTFAFTGRGAVSQKYGDPENPRDVGFHSNINFAKTGGNLRYSVGHSLESDNYDINDLGFLRAPNENNLSGSVSYYQFDPFACFLSMSGSFSASYNRLYNPNVYTSLGLRGSLYSTFKNFIWTSLWYHLAPLPQHDYFEPRVWGQFVEYPKYYGTGFSLGTDGRRRLAGSTYLSYYQTDEENRYSLSLGFAPRFRVNDKLTFSTNHSGSISITNIGYVDHSDQSIFFGARDINTVTNIVNTQFTFNNTMDLNFRMRHYWSAAEYTDYFILAEQGMLHHIDYQKNHDKNFNVFNIDMVYTWVFSPASELSIVWKSQVLNDDPTIPLRYFRNFADTFDAPMDNSISLRILYFLDYAMIARSRRG
ncbi:MAG: carbohydrate binding family 9 domain-containing protein [Cyclobacteriaceae bacterium]|nr:carbohydrate binding family 9 domain-containing protein [Cyclobacteriaceae bacterium]